MTDASTSWSCAYLQVSLFWRPRPSAEATPAMSIYRKGLVSIALLWYGAALACMLERGRRRGWEPFQKNLKYLLFCAVTLGSASLQQFYVIAVRLSRWAPEVETLQMCFY